MVDIHTHLYTYPKRKIFLVCRINTNTTSYSVQLSQEQLYGTWPNTDLNQVGKW
jgi:hypothetical protein